MVPPTPPRLQGDRLVRAVAHRLLAGAFAGAEPDLLGGRRLVINRRERCDLVRAIAERLLLRTPTGAPPVALAGLDVDHDRPSAADFRHLAHWLFPPPSVASHASPHALASSRTRRM